jgi:hypothetical protein
MDSDLGGQLITGPGGFGSYLKIFVTSEKICCKKVVIK